MPRPGALDLLHNESLKLTGAGGLPLAAPATIPTGIIADAFVSLQLNFGVRLPHSTMRCGLSLPYIYADFNGLQRVSESPPRYSVALDTWGTLRDLSNAGLRLIEGLELVVWDESDENEDLEGEAIARFDSTSGTWWADFKAAGYRYVPTRNREEVGAFLCLACRHEVIVGTGAGGWIPPAQRCRHCGMDFRAAIAPPAA